MPTPGFAAGTLDHDGSPAWITDLAGEDYNHTVHVVRDLEPADALQLLGARPRMITSCQLPAGRPDRRMSLPRAAIGPTGSAAVLLAGRIGAWTFVYDDSGLTRDGDGGDPPAKLLSAGGGVAATSTEGSSLNTSFAYAVDGILLFGVIDDGIGPGDAVPAGLRPAVDAAGILETEDLEQSEPDFGINMRVLCALAGLHCTLEDLRQIPLLAAPFS